MLKNENENSQAMKNAIQEAARLREECDRLSATLAARDQQILAHKGAVRELMDKFD